MRDLTVNRFRQARGLLLAKKIKAIRQELNRDINILDVGGRPDYWDNLSTDGVAKIVVMNYDPVELDRLTVPNPLFENVVGDARNLSNYADHSIDLVHSNSVIEHVGAWWDMEAMAREVLRVGRHGWVQTPAYEFPIEPHYRMPFVHWVGQSARRSLLRLSGKYGRMSVSERRFNVDRINLLSRGEVEALFPGREIIVERVLFPKSYTVVW